MPMAGMLNSDLIQTQGYKTVADPYTGREVVAMPAIRADWAIIHVHEADLEGNSLINGSLFEDLLLVAAADKVLVTCEKLLLVPPARVDLPGFLVTSVVEVPGGAKPSSCGQDYPYDLEYLQAYLKAAAAEDTLAEFLRSRILEGGAGIDS